MSNAMSVLPSEYHSKLTLDRSNVLDVDSYLSKSAIWEFHKGSAYKWKNAPRQFKTTAAMNWGSLVDCLTTTPEDFDNQFIVRPDTYLNDKNDRKPWSGNAEVCKKFNKKAEDRNLIVIKQEELDEARKAADNLLIHHKESSEIFADSDTQVIMICPLLIEVGGKEYKVNFKGLLDLAPRSTKKLSDLKTTGKFTKEGFSRTISDLGYHVQGGLYRMMWNLIHSDGEGNIKEGFEKTGFDIIWQDSSPPYEVAVTEMDSVDLDEGCELGMVLIREIILCSIKDEWKMNHEGVMTIKRNCFSGSIEIEEREALALKQEQEVAV